MQDAASEMLYPIMPILLTSVLGAPALVVGMIEGLAEATAATVKLISNQLNKFMSRKTMIFIGYGAAALGKLFIAMAATWPIVLLGRMTDRVGKGMRSAPRDALLVEDTDSAHRGRIIGFHRTADTLGAVVGPVLALFLLAALNNDIKSVLWFALIPASISIVLIVAVRDNGTKLVPKNMPAKDGSQKLSKGLSTVIGAISIFSLVNFPDALLLLHISQLGLDVTAVVGAYLLYNVSYAALSFPVGSLADRFNPKNIFALGLLCFAITYCGLALTTNHAITLALMVVYGGFTACYDTVGKSWVAKLAPNNQQLKAQARLQGLSGYSILIAGLWAGALWGVSGGLGTVPLLIAGAVTAGVSILIFANPLGKATAAS